MSEIEILFERRGAAGLVTLNRPKALNAVTHGMVRALRAQLDDWADDPAITRVVITAAGERAFSAGGDIRALYDLGQRRPARRGAAVLARRISAQRRDQEFPQALCRADRRHRHGRRRRRVGARLASRRRRPLSVRHAGSRHRLFPRCRRHLVPAAHAGRARHLLRADRRALRRRRRASPPASPPIAFRRRALPALLDGLDRHGVGRCRARGLRRAGRARGRSSARRAAIDRLFAGDRVEDILAALDARSGSAAPMPNGPARPPPPCATKSPLSLKLALAQVRRGKAWDFDDVHARRIPHSVAHHPWP